jgi:Tfp pilus assembly protein PilO
VKSSDRTILAVVAVVGLMAAFWFLVLSPKRQEASDLSEQVTTLQGQVAQEEADASTAGAAKTDFKSNYHELVTLGKAVPVDADTPSLLTQLQELSSDSDVQFQSISLGGGTGGSVPANAQPLTATTGTPTSATPTEATASLLPIGASVGAAGLPIMPYALTFQGSFFDVADFFGGIDDLVEVKGEDNKVSVDGRLLTIDDFTLAPVDGGSDQLVVSVNATSYLSPADQGATGGATPTGPLATTPAPAAAPATSQPVSPAVVGN